MLIDQQCQIDLVLKEIVNNTSLGSFQDSRTQFQYLINNLVCLERWTEIIRQDCKQILKQTCKDKSKCHNYLKIAHRFNRLPSKWEKSLFYCQKALLQCPDDDSLKSRIYFKMAKLFAYKAQSNQSALQCINQAIEIAFRNPKKPGYCCYYLWKAKLLAKSKQWNQLNNTVYQMQSIDDRHSHGLIAWIDNYKQLLLQKHSFRNDAFFVQDEMEDRTVSTEFEFDSNCRIEYESEKYGRHLMCRGNAIPYGTYIIRERVISAVFNGEHISQRCFWCYRQLGQVKYPCRKCNQISFCNYLCEKEASQGFHQFECGLISLLISSSTAWHIFRLITLIGLDNVLQFFRHKQTQSLNVPPQQQQQQQPDKLVKDFVQDTEQLNRFKFEQVLQQPDGRLLQMKLLTLIDSFVGHQPKNIKQGTSLLLALKMIILAIVVEEGWPDDLPTTLKKPITIGKNQPTLSLSSVCSSSCRSDNPNSLKHWLFSNKTDIILIADGLSKMIEKLWTNSFGWCEPNPDDLNESVVIGNCVCLVSCLINHSCKANAYWSIEDGYITITTFSRIQNGSQINISYGPNDCQDFLSRQAQLENQFGFICQCSSCVDDCQSLFCLSCSHCEAKGPIIDLLGTRRCFLCNVNYSQNDYWHRYQQTIRNVIKLKSLCRTGDKDGDGKMIINLLDCLHRNIARPSIPFIRVVFLVVDCFISNGIHLNQAFHLIDRNAESIAAERHEASLIMLESFILAIRLLHKHYEKNEPDKMEPIHIMIERLYWKLSERIKEKMGFEGKEHIKDCLNFLFENSIILTQPTLDSNAKIFFGPAQKK